MARTATLTTLISDVRTKGDFAGATVRHTDAQITRLLNQSIQRFRERISDEGSEHYLVSSSGTLGVGPTSPYPFYQLDLSALSPAMVRPYGVDVTFPGGDVKTLDRVPFEMRAKYGTTTQGGTPQAWAPFKDGQIAILPASSTAYAYTVWYLPVLADLSSGSDTFDGVAGWEDFIVWDVVAQLIARDQFPQAYGIAVAQRDGVWADILRGATRVTQAGGAHLGRDSFGGKLPLFLGDRRPTKTAVGGPVVPATGSVTDAMLADMTGPTVKGVLSGTTRPYSVGVATLTTYLSQFSTTQRGLVPPPLSVSNLFLRDDGTWAAGGGGGAGNSVGPSGAVQYQAGTGFAGASGLRIIGNSPSLLVRLEGSMRVTGGQVEVGSGTVRISASGVDVGGGSVINVGTLVASAIAGPAVTDTTAGLAPASGGGTSNFLRADGAWAAPAGGGSPGGASGAVQFNAGGSTFGGHTGLTVLAANFGLGFRPGLAFGSPAVLGNNSIGGNADVRIATGWRMAAATASGGYAQLYTWTAPVDGATGGFITVGINNGTGDPAPGSALRSIVHEVASGGGYFWRHGGVSGTTVFLRATGMKLPAHLHAQSLSVGSGIPNDQLSPMASGTIKGQLDADGIPTDIPIASLTTALYPFNSSNRGVVPGSGGGSANFLRADGTWAVPPGTGGAASPGGGTSNMQFRDAAGTFGGASGILAVASGSALQLGGPTAASVGWIRGGQTMSVYGMHPSLTDVRMLGMGTGSVEIGQSGIAAKVYGDFSAQNLTLASGLADSSLAPMGSGTVKGRLIGTGTPSDISIPTLHAFAPTFTATRPGTVPESGGSAQNFLRGDGVWAAPSGAVQYPPGGPSGALQYRVASGFAGATTWGVQGGTQLISGTPTGDAFAAANLGLYGQFTIQGKDAAQGADQTLYLWAPSGTTGSSGSTVTYGRGSGTIGLHRFQTAPSGAIHFELGPSGANSIRFMQTGIDFSNYPLAVKGLRVSSGIPNTELSPMASGTVKGQLGADATPNDIPIPTLLGLVPTFTSTQKGTVPPSGGGTTNFLRADGTWAAPPGGSATPGGADTNLQYNNVGAFGGASGLNVAAPFALGFGVPSFLPGAGDIRVASGFNITGNLPSGVGGVAARQSLFDWSGGGASGTLKVGGASGVLGTLREEVATGGSFQWLIGGQTGMALSQTGIDASPFNLKIKSLDVGSINGLPFTWNNVKRGADLGGSSGVPSGLTLYTPRGSSTGANRYIVPSGFILAGSGSPANHVILSPTGARGGQVIRIERIDTTGAPLEVRTPTGTVLLSMPSGTKYWGDFMLTKPSGAAFELAGHADMF